ncbi:hypothetical protein NP233_g6687 [Leucocoprinus birnbaumii]|uniref:Uncharacterized protein n=1 Tax=Leucocoprinus birnbaumii TaxID=56174 RepID=A0AAD5YPS9_9AGAR|nr:hypothetical protein NP233_g6687 [Leucocoprinus birnbaumii]
MTISNIYLFPASSNLVSLTYSVPPTSSDIDIAESTAESLEYHSITSSREISNAIPPLNKLRDLKGIQRPRIPKGRAYHLDKQLLPEPPSMWLFRAQYPRHCCTARVLTLNDHAYSRACKIYLFTSRKGVTDSTFTVLTCALHYSYTTLVL